ncbi:class I SAM-dependent methyltransferase [Corynebacterium casei]|uniref:class I SAM-dependent methyltransferase n=1 Tax=Corynebacterium casei TaxID=160386 RepID=UPI003FD502BF
MNRKLIFSAAIVALGALGSWGVFLLGFQLFYIVVLILLLAIVSLLGVVIFLARDSHRSDRQRQQEEQKKSVLRNKNVLNRMNSQGEILRKLQSKQLESVKNDDKRFKLITARLERLERFQLEIVQSGERHLEHSETVSSDLEKIQNGGLQTQKLFKDSGKTQVSTFNAIASEFREALSSELEPILRALEIGAQRQTTFFDSLRNILEDLEGTQLSESRTENDVAVELKHLKGLKGGIPESLNENKVLLDSYLAEFLNGEILQANLRAHSDRVYDETRRQSEALANLGLQLDGIGETLQERSNMEAKTDLAGVESRIAVLSDKLLELKVQVESYNSWNLSNLSTQFSIFHSKVSNTLDSKIQPLKADEILQPISKSISDLEIELSSRMDANKENLFYKLQIAMYEETQEVEALLRLVTKIEPRSVMPSLGRWAIDAKSMLQLVNVFETLNPQFVVEIGSGTSSIWLGYLAERSGAKVVSVEHEESFAKRTTELVIEHSLEDSVQVKHAPLSDVEINGETHAWYETDFIESLGQIDLLFVDGPVGSSSKKARYPALPLLAEKLSPYAVVILDDTHRKDEEEIAEDWATEYSLVRNDHSMSRLAILKKKTSM